MSGARQRHLLVVNDTPEILDLFREILEEEGYRVSLSSYAFRDLDDIKCDRPDLIVLDFIIGDENHGWQLLQKLKMDRETASIPIIVCTAATDLVRELEGQLREKGVGIVLKPFDTDDHLLEVNQRRPALAEEATKDADQGVSANPAAGLERGCGRRRWRPRSFAIGRYWVPMSSSTNSSTAAITKRSRTPARAAQAEAPRRASSQRPAADATRPPRLANGPSPMVQPADPPRTTSARATGAAN